MINLVSPFGCFVPEIPKSNKRYWYCRNERWEGEKLSSNNSYQSGTPILSCEWLARWICSKGVLDYKETLFKRTFLLGSLFFSHFDRNFRSFFWNNCEVLRRFPDERSDRFKVNCCMQIRNRIKIVLQIRSERPLLCLPRSLFPGILKFSITNSKYFVDNQNFIFQESGNGKSQAQFVSEL